MTIKRIQTGPRMSQAVIHNKTVYLAGQVAPGASVAIQTREILASIDALLAHGADANALDDWGHTPLDAVEIAARSIASIASSSTKLV